MEKEDLIKRLRDCNSGDTENDHLTADDLLLEYIDDKEITDAYNEVDKWYA